MSNTTFSTTAVLCTGASSVLVGDPWRERVVTRAAMQPSIGQPSVSHLHNSIVSARGGASAPAGVLAYDADKQAAPPRGIPR
jgi:hypothetical protein